MKTTKEILKEIETLQGSSQTLQPKSVLGVLSDLARVVYAIEQRLPHAAEAEEIDDLMRE